MACTTRRGHRTVQQEIARLPPTFHLPFLDHCQDFNLTYRPLSGMKVFEAQHRSREPFDASVVLLDTSVQIFALTDF